MNVFFLQRHLQAFASPPRLVFLMFSLKYNTMPNIGPPLPSSSAIAIFLIPLFAADIGYSEQTSSLILGVAAVFLAIGAPLAGYCLDKYRRSLFTVFNFWMMWGAVACVGFAAATLAPNLIWLFSALVRFVLSMTVSCKLPNDGGVHMAPLANFFLP